MTMSRNLCRCRTNCHNWCRNLGNRILFANHHIHSTCRPPMHNRRMHCRNTLRNSRCCRFPRNRVHNSLYRYVRNNLLHRVRNNRYSHVHRILCLCPYMLCMRPQYSMYRYNLLDTCRHYTGYNRCTRMIRILFLCDLFFWFRYYRRYCPRYKNRCQILSMNRFPYLSRNLHLHPVLLYILHHKYSYLCHCIHLHIHCIQGGNLHIGRIL